MFLPQRESYDALISDFRWEIPERFNIGRCSGSTIGRSATPDRLALEHFSPDGRHARLTYGQLRDRSNQLANALVRLGVKPGDRVALLLPQSFDTVIAHIAIYKMGAIALPLGTAVRRGRAGLPAAGFGRGGRYHHHVRPVEARRCQGSPTRSGPCHRVRRGDGRRDGTGSADGGPSGDLRRHRQFEGRSGADDLHGRARPARPRARCMPTGCCRAMCRACRWRRTSCRNHQTSSGRRPTGPGRADCSNCLLPSLMMGVPVVSSPAQKFDPDLAFRIMAETGVRKRFHPADRAAADDVGREPARDI